ncbi:branched-chain amino acid ABC transporter permease [Bradyrhizobium sp. NP1]|uniref:branched-chain amino acid ABC transporter permease n=1 Tax=Bradyrhizobium sp. NP1 TaxID=3049772 RepID=UPI0025A5EF68|nr:branched-chain amino acid ABC transporter permease [Bradyrhizobium sp. NP1]WJR79155.1 branched-chain amino acid ABC transporter permease [Bradyrhizobium sp. NP1]
MTIEATTPHATTLHLRPIRAMPAVLVAVAAALVPPLAGETFLLYIATLVGLYAIGAMSIHLIFRVGQFSLGQAAFLGIGGYTSALLTTGLHLSWWLSLVAGAALSAAIGAIVGPVVLRLKGVYFVLFTFTFGEFVRQIFVDWTSVTGGSEGIAGIAAPQSFSSPTGFYYLVLAFALLTAAVCGRLLMSQFGDAVDAIRESESLAQSNGIPVFRVKIIVFVISCAFLGVQGSLQASFVHYISPLSYGFPESLKLVVINVIGGLNTLWGPVLGSVFIVALPELLRNWVDYQWVLYGLALILLMRYLPGGLCDIGVLLRSWREPAGRDRS